ILPYARLPVPLALWGVASGALAGTIPYLICSSGSSVIAIGGIGPPATPGVNYGLGRFASLIVIQFGRKLGPKADQRKGAGYTSRFRLFHPTGGEVLSRLSFVARGNYAPVRVDDICLHGGESSVLPSLYEVRSHTPIRAFVSKPSDTI